MVRIPESGFSENTEHINPQIRTTAGFSSREVSQTQKTGVTLFLKTGTFEYKSVAAETLKLTWLMAGFIQQI